MRRPWVSEPLARAEQLAARELTAEAAQRVEALRACGIHRWVLAWGTGSAAETHLVTERYDASGKRLETREKVLAGDVAFEPSTWLSPADDGTLVPPASPPSETSAGQPSPDRPDSAETPR